jgi:hypothetical protein
MDFSPIFGLVIIWLLIGLPLSWLNKVAKKKTAQNQANAKPAKTNAAAKAATASRQVPPQRLKPESVHEGSSIHPSVMQPTITITEHDDSVYQGSLNAETGEGFDPCHDEQLAPLFLAETAMPAVETAESGLQLEWTGSEVVRGFVMSEILKRKTR